MSVFILLNSTLNSKQPLKAKRKRGRERERETERDRDRDAGPPLSPATLILVAGGQHWDSHASTPNAPRRLHGGP